jgi:hypothetical protein
MIVLRNWMYAALALGAFLRAPSGFCQVGEYINPNSIPESEVVFVAEGRIGNAAGAGAPTEFELDIGATTAAPSDTADFPWMSGQSEVFRVEYDPALLTNGNRFVQFFVGASNVVYELPSTVYTNAASGCGDVYIRTRSAKAGGSITNINISVTVAGQTIPLVHNSVGSSGGNDVDALKIGGQLLQAGFRITGNTTLAWNPSNKPARSQLAFQIKFTQCPAIASVEWREADPEAGFTNLTNDNPASHGGGFRLFAEQNVPGGPIHSNVIARANFVNPIPAGQTNAVYFRLFDVDDPTQNFTNNAANVADPLDTATAFAGDDNRLSAGDTGLGASPAGIISTNVVGPASFVDFRYHITDRQPGNNWKVVASCSSNYLADVILDTSSTGRGTNFLCQATSSTVSTNMISPLLSVWRTLHIEVDSMEQEPDSALTKEPDIDNILSESIQPNVPVAGQSTIDTFGAMGAPTEDFYEGGQVGRLGVFFQVLSHTANILFGDQIVVLGVPTPAQAALFTDSVVQIRDNAFADNGMNRAHTHS